MKTNLKIFAAVIGALLAALIVWLLVRARKKKATIAPVAAAPATAVAASVSSYSGSSGGGGGGGVTSTVREHIISNVTFTDGVPYLAVLPSGWTSTSYIIEMTEGSGAAVLADTSNRTATGFTVNPTFNVSGVTIRVVSNN